MGEASGGNADKCSDGGSTRVRTLSGEPRNQGHVAITGMERFVQTQDAMVDNVVGGSHGRTALFTYPRDRGQYQ